MVVLLPHGAERLFVISEHAIVVLNDAQGLLALRDLVVRHRLDEVFIPTPSPDLLAVALQQFLPPGPHPVEDLSPSLLRLRVDEAGRLARGGLADPRCVRCEGSGTSCVDAHRRRVPSHRCPSCRARFA